MTEPHLMETAPRERLRPDPADVATASPQERGPGGAAPAPPGPTATAPVSVGARIGTVVDRLARLDRERWIYGGIGIALALVAFAELLGDGLDRSNWAPAALFAVLVGLTVAIMRRHPSAALATAWCVGLVQLVGGVPLTFAEVPLIAVLFFAARFGRVAAVVLSGVTVPVAIGAGLLLPTRSLAWTTLGYSYRWWNWAPFLALVVVVALVGAWLLGLVLRFVDRAAAARRALESAEDESARAVTDERAARQRAALAAEEAATASRLAVAAEERATQAEEIARQAEALAAQSDEIARLRERQAALTRDVHDVVGHSLTVILAQAESAQFLADDDVTGLKATMRTVATAARASLKDVRDVLTPGAPRRTPARLAAILASVADMNGRDTAISQVGSPRPLPPELDEVACRVLQEMLTNALRHGAVSGPLRVELAWPDDGGLADSLRIEVVNDLDVSVGTGDDGSRGESRDAVRAAEGESVRQADGESVRVASAPARAGRGIEGMRRRLASVGGRLDVRRRGGECHPDGAGRDRGGTFTAAAIVPVRDVGARATSAEDGAPESTTDLDAEAAVAPAASASTHPAGHGSGPDAPAEDEPTSDEASEDAPGADTAAVGTAGSEPDVADGGAGEPEGAPRPEAADGEPQA